MRRVLWAGLLLLPNLLASPRAASQEPRGAPPASAALYDGGMKVTPPPEWTVKRAWDVISPGTTTRDLPLYRSDLMAVAYVGGREKAYPAGELKEEGVVEGLSVLTFYWPSEAGRFYPALGEVSSSEPKSGTLVIGESYKPGSQNYLGQLRFGKAEVELVEWLSSATLGSRFTEEHKLPKDFKGRRLQCILGQARFDGRADGYLITACRFVLSEHGLDWITPLLAGIEPVSPAEKGEAEKQPRFAVWSWTLQTPCMGRITRRPLRSWTTL